MSCPTPAAACLLCPPPLQEAIKVVQPLLLWKIIQFFESYEPGDQSGLVAVYCYAAALSLSAFALTVLQHVYYYLVLRTGMKMRVAVCHLIYGKVSSSACFVLRWQKFPRSATVKKVLCVRQALSLSSESMCHTTTGQIVNLLSNDVNRFDEVQSPFSFTLLCFPRVMSASR